MVQGATWWAAVLLMSSAASAQTTTGTISGRIVDSQGLALPGVTVTVAGPNLQGTLTVVSTENGDYMIPRVPPGTYTRHVRAQRLPASGEVRHHRTQPGADPQHRARPRLAHRNRRRAARRGRDPHAYSRSRHELQAGTDGHAADDTRHQRRDVEGARRSPLRAERQLFDCRLDVLRIALPRQRRQREREPARPGQQPLHRGCRAGDDGRDRWHFGRVRPFQRRRGQRGDQVRRQPVQRLVPRLALQ